MNQVIDACVHCGESTAFGSGRFVNRVGANDGWSCAECLRFDCDRCGRKTGFDEDIAPHDCGLEEFSDGSDRICDECLTPAEATEVEKPCERTWDVDGWWCINDHTGCLWNNGHNECLHEGGGLAPLEDEDE